MFARPIRSTLLVAMSATALLIPAAGASAADQLVNGNLYVVGSGCIGIACPSAGALDKSFMVRNTDTPVVRLDQTNGSGFTPQIWDVAGNEANFFVRDVTGGSKLPFRVRPGAPTSAIDIGANGYSTASQQFALNITGTNINALDPSTVVSKLGSVSFETYESTGTPDTQYRPNLAELSSQFGGSATLLNPSSVASLALAGVKKNASDLQSLSAIPGQTTALTSRVSTLETQNASLKKSNKKLAKQYKSLAKSLKSLKKQVRKLR